MNRLRQGASDLYAHLTGAGPLTRLLREWSFERFDVHPGHARVDAGSVVRWDELGRRAGGSLQGWSSKGGSYRGVSRLVPQLASFGRCTRVESWSCDIQDVVGISNSKSRLREYSTLDSMIESNRPSWLGDLSEERVAELLAYKEVRLGRPGASDHLSLNLWDGRVMLMNDGGSHHFAAARYVAARIQRNTPINGPLCIYEIDELSLDSMLEAYDMIVIPGEPRFSNWFHKAMESYRATFFSLDLPRPYTAQEGRIVLLPRDEPRSAKVAEACKQGGLFDLGTHLDMLMAVQRSNAERLSAQWAPPPFAVSGDGEEDEDESVRYAPAG
ncbi:DUF6685 family protein [Variovorax ginsengisoli]|uniref:Uncharacterized protein n=1 Tax=Variovorax ginsengisoli TaxID=363844 RepID=A0ABT8SBT0_9BURK|nr:DUF6685 family protein [Variovorax ginsengisoli]MDN8617196.1 hypothetical protein [Variovorax ginsengisoli]MDO1536366.1 hypothetical protein [Variovorax ginsengisoli]